MKVACNSQDSASEPKSEDLLDKLLKGKIKRHISGSGAIKLTRREGVGVSVASYSPAECYQLDHDHKYSGFIFLRFNGSDHGKPFCVLLRFFATSGAMPIAQVHPHAVHQLDHLPN